MKKLLLLLLLVCLPAARVYAMDKLDSAKASNSRSAGETFWCHVCDLRFSAKGVSQAQHVALHKQCAKCKKEHDFNFQAERCCKK